METTLLGIKNGSARHLVVEQKPQSCVIRKATFLASSNQDAISMVAIDQWASQKPLLPLLLLLPVPPKKARSKSPSSGSRQTPGRLVLPWLEEPAHVESKGL